MKTENKQEYIKQWQDYIQGLGTLSLCRDEKMANKIQDHIKELNELVVKIADTKNFKEGEEKWKHLEQKLKTFDYTYMMSDDFGVWQAGERDEKVVCELIEGLSKLDINRVEKLIEKYKQEYGAQFKVKK